MLSLNPSKLYVMAITTMVVMWGEQLVFALSIDQHLSFHCLYLLYICLTSIYTHRATVYVYKFLEQSVYCNLLTQCYNPFNYLYYPKRNRGLIISWRFSIIQLLYNRNGNLRLPLTRFLAIASLCERSNTFISIIRISHSGLFQTTRSTLYN